MSSIDALKSKLAKLETSNYIDALIPKSSGWLSRKLGVVLAVIAALIIIGRDNQNSIIAGIITLCVVYLIVQGVNDLMDKFVEGWTRVKIIEGMAKDGLTKEEIETITGVPAAPAAAPAASAP
jgi:hypothetical protein